MPDMGSMRVQVLNRLTYASTLSHLRRINSPIGREGKLAKPRQLHNSQVGLPVIFTSDAWWRSCALALLYHAAPGIHAGILADLETHTSLHAWSAITSAEVLRQTSFQGVECTSPLQDLTLLFARW